ncbi:MAG: hypothetical protein KDA84_12495 [Planctomycetaceae bacterium]|nr:hypothetical protein [Planctomycetaceae bacterium]
MIGPEITKKITKTTTVTGELILDREDLEKLIRDNYPDIPAEVEFTYSCDDWDSELIDVTVQWSQTETEEL